jgi:hypothetical protein
MIYTHADNQTSSLPNQAISMTKHKSMHVLSLAVVSQAMDADQARHMRPTK